MIHAHTRLGACALMCVCLLSLHTGQHVCIPTHGSVTSAFTALPFIRLFSSDSRCASLSWTVALGRTVSENRWINTRDRWREIYREGWQTNLVRKTKDEHCGRQWVMSQECREVYCTYAALRRLKTGKTRSYSDRRMNSDGWLIEQYHENWENWKQMHKDAGAGTDLSYVSLMFPFKRETVKIRDALPWFWYKQENLCCQRI